MARRLIAVSPVDHPGGAETCLLRLLAGLKRRGWSIALTTPGAGPLRDAALDAGYAWHALPLGGLVPRSGARAVRSWRTARSLAREASVVYLNGAVCGRLLPALPPGARRVLHIHDMVDRVPPFWHRADVVLAASGAVASRLHGLAAHVVYGPVDPDPPAATAPWPTGNGPVVGFIGRFEPRKGPLDLVRAAPAIRAGAPGARIVMVGDDPYGADPDYVRAVRAAPDVEHHPWSANAPGLMRHLDVLVLPSRVEPFGTVLSEAMAVDLWDTGVNVMAVYPGVIDTELFTLPDNDVPDLPVAAEPVSVCVDAVLAGAGVEAGSTGAAQPSEAVAHP